MVQNNCLNDYLGLVESRKNGNAPEITKLPDFLKDVVLDGITFDLQVVDARPVRANYFTSEAQLCYEGFGPARISVGGIFQGVGLVWGRGGAPPDAGEFAKICTKYRKKIAKMHYFQLIFPQENLKHR